MKTTIGIILMVGGVGVGLYVGVYLMFIGGIIDIVDYIKDGLANNSLLIWGIVKIVFAQFVGAISALFLFVPGQKMSGLL